MAFDQKKIADIVRDTLVTKYGYQVEGDYVRKPISNNYAIGFYEGSREDNPLSICIYHREGAGFSNNQSKIIKEVLNRPEFQGSYCEPQDGKSTDGRAEIWCYLTESKFYNWGGGQDVADWIVRLFEHFITTVNLLELT